MGRIELAGLGPGIALRWTILGLLAAGGNSGTLTLHSDGSPIPIYTAETGGSPDPSGSFTTDLFGRPPGWVDDSYLGEDVDITIPPAATITVKLGGPPGPPTIPRGVYDPAISYDHGDLVTFDGLPYASLIDGNHGNQPDTNPAKWLQLMSIPSGVLSVSPPPTEQGQSAVWDALADKWAADAGVFSPRGDRAIAVTNSCPDPRATTSANFSAQASGTGSISQSPTGRVDGYHQLATPKSCQEIVGTPDGLANHFVKIGTAFAANGQPVKVNVNRPVVAVRASGKISGSLGSSWMAGLYIFYFDASGAFLRAVLVWSGGPNQITPGVFFDAEGFDCQAPAGADHFEVSLSVVNSTAGNPVTIRFTEIVMAPDPDGDIPGYVGGDAPGGIWTGTKDASASIAQFDPLSSYPAQDYGANPHQGADDVTSNTPPVLVPFSQAQGIAMQRAAGANVVRVGCGFWIGSGPAAPTVATPTRQWHQKLIDAGMKLILDVGGFPAWMAPTHLPAQSGNGGGSISSGATTMHAPGGLPARIALPFKFQWADGSSEVATMTAYNGGTGVATITRGSGATSHNDGVNLVDALFNTALGHIYYPDASFRATLTTALVNYIAILGASNVRAVQFSNEPNIWADDTRAEGAAGYTAMLNAIYTAVKAADPSILILGGTLACNVTADSAGFTDSNEYLQGMFTAGAQYDALDCHFYTTGVIGEGNLCSSADLASGGSPGFTSGLDTLIKRTKDMLALNGAASMPIYVTETAISVTPQQTNPQPGIGERMQAQALSLSVGRMRRDPQIIGICNNMLADYSIGADSGGGLFELRGLRMRAAGRQMAAMRGMVPAMPAPGEIVRYVPDQISTGLSYLQSPWPVAANFAKAGQVALGLFGLPRIDLGAPYGQQIVISEALVGAGQTLEVSDTIDGAGMVRALGIGTIPITGKGAELFLRSATSAYFQGYDRGANAFIPAIVSGSEVTLAAQTNNWLTTASPTGIPAIILGAAGQTGDMTSWLNSSLVQLARVTASGLIVASSGLQVPSGAAANTVAAGDASGNLSWLSLANVLPWTITLVPLLGAQDAGVKVGTWANTVDATSLLNGWISNSSLAQHDEIGWHVPLAAGTWTFSLLYRKSQGSAIYTVLVDGVSVGTIDSYNATTAVNQLASIAGITIATNGKHLVSVKAETRNGSSINWALAFGMIQLRRTA